MSCTRLIVSGAVSGTELAAAYVWRGAHLGKTHDHDGAIDDYNTALKIDPKSVTAYMARGLSFELKGDLNGALADYRMAATIDPQMNYAADAVKRVEDALATRP